VPPTPPPRQKKMKRITIKDIQIGQFVVAGPSGVLYMPSTQAGQAPVTCSLKEVECDEEIFDGDPMEADTGVPVQGEAPEEEVPLTEEATQNDASRGGDCPDAN